MSAAATTAADAPAARPLPPLLPALLHLAWLGARQALAQRTALLGRCVFLVLILLIYQRLWGAVAAGGLLTGTDARGLLWYLALTEWIVLGLPLLHLTIEQDVRSGDVASALTRPVPWLAAKLAEGAGTLLVRLALMGVTACAGAYALSGGLPAEPRGLLFAVPLALLSGLLGSLLYAWVGLATFWLGDCTPVHWVVQKLCFLLGGLMLPLSVYPDLLRDVAAWTPFAAMLDGVGRTALSCDPAQAGRTALSLCAWLAVFGFGMALTWSRALRRVDGAGG